MATTNSSKKSKKLSWISILSVVLQVLPVVLTALNDGAQTASITFDRSQLDDNINANVFSVAKDGTFNLHEDATKRM